MKVSVKISLNLVFPTTYLGSFLIPPRFIPSSLCPMPLEHLSPYWSHDICVRTRSSLPTTQSLLNRQDPLLMNPPYFPLPLTSSPYISCSRPNAPSSTSPHFSYRTLHVVSSPFRSPSPERWFLPLLPPESSFVRLNLVERISGKKKRKKRFSRIVDEKNKDIEI